MAYSRRECLLMAGALSSAARCRRAKATNSPGVDQPVHALCLKAVGTPLMDNCDLEGLGRAASERGRWAFCFTMAPLQIPGATGSPANPIATF